MREHENRRQVDAPETKASSGVSLADLEDALRHAAREVVVLGVVPFDIHWHHVLSAFVDQAQPAPGLTFVCESDNWLFAQALVRDSADVPRRLSFVEMRFKRDQFIAAVEDVFGRYTNVKISHLDLPLAVIRADDLLFVATYGIPAENGIFQVESDSTVYQLVDAYLESRINSIAGRRFSSRAGEELLQLFDHGRVPRGIYPRVSFYDTDFSQQVVWAFIFDRRGRLLIHRRAANARDNQAMWDKSVGGHVDYSMDVDSSNAVGRELIEELFSEDLHLGLRPCS